MTYTTRKSKYMEIDIATADRVDLVTMCYDKSIQCLRHAKDHLIDHEYESKCDMLGKAINIISELKSSIDFVNGGEIANNLDAIYTYLINRLVEGDLKKDLAVYDEVINILSEIKGAWEGISSKEDNHLPINNSSKNITKSLQQIAA